MCHYQILYVLNALLKTLYSYLLELNDPNWLVDRSKLTKLKQYYTGKCLCSLFPYIIAIEYCNEFISKALFQGNYGKDSIKNPSSFYY